LYREAVIYPDEIRRIRDMVEAKIKTLLEEV
jgi:hypothetical protein